ncbi:MAG TPA: glycosyltransferase family 2 protein, partial [Blastocatellia bacterium]
SVFQDQTNDGFGFDPEVLFIAAKRGWRLLEVPVICNHVEGSKVNMLTTPVKVLLEVLKIRRNDLLGLYDGAGEIRIDPTVEASRSRD